MKLIISALFISLIVGGPKIEFDKYIHDFGEVDEGKKVSHVFIFKNTGDEDLIIKEAKSSCGCTVGSFSKEPVKPGEKGQISVVFNTMGRTGRNAKYVDVYTNADVEPITLKIVAFVD